MDLLIIALAGFLGGMLNAIAGGGSFFTLSALVFIGVPPVIANATGTAALLPGYIASAWRFRHDIELPKNLSFVVIAIIAILGGSTGAAVLLLTNETLFSQLVPWLILFATAAFVVGPLLMNKGSKLRETQSKKPLFKAIIILSLVCFYGGYFNGGLGIILLAALSLLGQSNLHGMIYSGTRYLITSVILLLSFLASFSSTPYLIHFLLFL